MNTGSEHNKDQRWLRNDTVARYLELIFQDRDDIELIVGLQSKDHLADYYLQRMAHREEDVPAQNKRFITYHLKNNNHFVLTAFEVKDDFVEVMYLDPMGAPMPKDIQAQYMKAFDGQVVIIPASTPQQKDAINCGVYLVDNAETVAMTETSLQEIADNKDSLFRTLAPREIQDKRQHMVNTLNQAYPDCYTLAQDGSITLVSDAQFEVPKVSAKQYKAHTNSLVNALLDKGDVDAKGFEAMFDRAVDAYQTLETAHMLEQYGSTKLLADTVRFFKSADSQFSKQHKVLETQVSARQSHKSCASEVEKLHDDEDLINNHTLTSAF